MVEILLTLKKVVPVTATGLTALFGPASKGGSSVYDQLKAKKYAMAGHHFIQAMTGINLAFSPYTDLGSGAASDQIMFDAFEALNPLEMGTAPVPKVALWSSIIVEGITKVGSFIRSLWSDLT